MLKGRPFMSKIPIKTNKLTGGMRNPLPPKVAPKVGPGALAAAELITNYAAKPLTEIYKKIPDVYDEGLWSFGLKKWEPITEE